MSRVTVGVPVYRGAPFLAEALASIRAQTHHDLTVIISLDGPDRASEEAARPFLEDARFRLVIHPRRRGWVENLNWLLSQVDSPYWCYQPQDDLLEPRYLEVLLEEARARPEAAVTYCDIRAFGELETTIVQPSVTGGPATRQLTLLHHHHSAVAFRGLTRAEALRVAGPARHNAVEDFSVDTAFVAALARAGELHRVPSALYQKRYHPGNAHVAWRHWPVERRAHGWVVHCADMFEQAMLVQSTISERRLLWLAAAGRLASPVAKDYLPEDQLDSSQRRTLVRRLVHELRSGRDIDLSRLLGVGWRRIRRMAEQLLEPPG